MPGEWYGEQLAARYRQAALEGVTTAIGIVENEAVRLILSGDKTGVVYRRRGVEHQSSAPGEAPASDTGRLVASRDIVIDTQAIRAALVFRTEYAIMLELGTVKMEPRPYGRAAIANTRDGIVMAIITPIRALSR